MICAEAQDQLHDLNREHLDATTRQSVEAHTRGCPTCGDLLRTDRILRSVVRANAPRFVAPPALRARLERALCAPAASAPLGVKAGARRVVSWPWMLGGLVGAVALVVLIWAGWSWLTLDPTTRLLSTAAAEHARSRQAQAAPSTSDPANTVQSLRAEITYKLPPAFLGDAGVQLIGTKVSTLAGREAATLIYREAHDRYTTLFMVPEAGITIPSEGRMKIATFAPYHRTMAGRQAFLWKQAGVVCLLITDLDPADSAAMFLKIRNAV